MAREGFKARLNAGRLLVGSYVSLPSPDVVELFAHAGMDYVVIDLQHSSPGWDTLAHMIRAADAAGAAPLVRVYTRDPAILLKLLDMGAEGINLPSVKSAAEVRAVLDAIYYAPLGHRGASSHTRAGGYNSRRAEFPAHVQRQNARVALWCTIEDRESLAHVGEIAALDPGPTVISVGRGDLATSMGVAGEVDHPHVIAAAERAIAEVKRHSGGKTASAAMVQRAEDFAPWHARGCRLFTYAADAILLMEAARRAVDAFRSVRDR
jgi:4-hydroxy-2-oxoheptanedioate aldolase